MKISTLISNRFVKLGLIAYYILIVMAVFPAVSYADSLSARIGEITSAKSESDLVLAIVKFSIPVAIMSLVGLFLYSGYQMMLSQGNPEKLNEARETIMNAVMGFLMIVLALAILLLIQSILEIPGITP